MSEYNYSLHAVAAGVGVLFFPHFTKIVLLNKWNGSYNNVNPRSQMEHVSKKLSKEQTNMLHRCFSAHLNGYESLFLFGLGVLAGNLAKLPVDKLNRMSLLYLVARMIFNLQYIYNTNPALSYVRTLIWGAGTYPAIHLLLEAGRALN